MQNYSASRVNCSVSPMSMFYHSTVNSGIFARVLFSRNFAYAKFRENKILANGEIITLFTDIGKSYPSHKF